MRYILAALIIIFAGCKSAEKIAAEKAAKEDTARKERIKLMEAARNEYPCDTVTKYYIDTLVRVLAGDTTIVNDTVYIRLPGKEITRTQVQTIIDRIEVEKLTLLLESMQYATQLQAEENILQDKKIRILEEKNKDLLKHKTTLLFIIIAMSACVAIYGFTKFKNVF